MSTSHPLELPAKITLPELPRELTTRHDAQMILCPDTRKLLEELDCINPQAAKKPQK